MKYSSKSEFQDASIKPESKIVTLLMIENFKATFFIDEHVLLKE